LPDGIHFKATTPVRLMQACRILLLPDGSIMSPALMPDVFWIGLGISAFCLLVGFIAGAKSSTTRTLTGVAIGGYLGLMAGFPLLAIGLATS
jgi:hypothetical protein